jgi:hypothetical protein
MATVKFEPLADQLQVLLYSWQALPRLRHSKGFKLEPGPQEVVVKVEQLDGRVVLLEGGKYVFGLKSEGLE